MRLNGASLAVAACLVLLATGSAIADDEPRNPNALLKGTYRHMASGSGAGAQTQSLNEPGFEPWPNLAALRAGNAGATPSLMGSLPTMARVMPWRHWTA